MKLKKTECLPRKPVFKKGENMKKIISVLGLVFLAGSIAFAAKHAPDLVVKEIKMDSTTLEAGQPVKIVYTIKNQGTHPSDPSVTSIKILSEEGKEMSKSIKKDIPSIAPNETYTAVVSCPLRTKGKYIIKATADYNNMIMESNETNNSNSLRFSIGFKL